MVGIAVGFPVNDGFSKIVGVGETDLTLSLTDFLLKVK
jgi:hypothetical protein